jgi:hypothetical protein
MCIRDRADDKYAVMCVKHDYNPESSIKMDNQVQTNYPRKNWSSVVLWNCGHPSNMVMGPDIINNIMLSGAYFHQFKWLQTREIGEIDTRWNWLAGWYKESDLGKPYAIHYTEGGPWFENYRKCEYAREWVNEYFEMMVHV